MSDSNSENVLEEKFISDTELDQYYPDPHELQDQFKKWAKCANVEQMIALTVIKVDPEKKDGRGDRITSKAIKLDLRKPFPINEIFDVLLMNYLSNDPIRVLTLFTDLITSTADAVKKIISDDCYESIDIVAGELQNKVLNAVIHDFGLGIAMESFAKVMQEEREKHPSIPLSETERMLDKTDKFEPVFKKIHQYVEDKFAEENLSKEDMVQVMKNVSPDVLKLLMADPDSPKVRLWLNEQIAKIVSQREAKEPHTIH